MTTPDDNPAATTGAICGPSGPRREPDDAAVELDPLTRTLLDLQAHIEAAEAVDWTLVPGISVAEAGAWTQKCDLAHDELSGDVGSTPELVECEDCGAVGLPERVEGGHDCEAGRDGRAY